MPISSLTIGIYVQLSIPTDDSLPSVTTQLFSWSDSFLFVIHQYLYYARVRYASATVATYAFFQYYKKCPIRKNLTDIDGWLGLSALAPRWCLDRRWKVLLPSAAKPYFSFPTVSACWHLLFVADIVSMSAIFPRYYNRDQRSRSTVSPN